MTAKRGVGSIKRQSKGAGLFAQVELEAAPAPECSITIQLDDDDWNPGDVVLDTYLPTIKAAIAFAQEKALIGLNRTELFNLGIVPRRIGIAPADTTCTAVFYATLLALEDSLDVKIPGVEPDWEQRELRLKF